MRRIRTVLSFPVFCLFALPGGGHVWRAFPASTSCNCVTTQDRSFSMMMGFIMKSLAPTLKPLTTSSLELRADKIIIWISAVSGSSRRRPMTFSRAW